MSIAREDVQRIAALAKLELSDADIERYAPQLARVLDYIEVLRTLPDAAEMTTDASLGQPLQPDIVTNPADAGIGQPLRSDVATNPADAELGLAAAPDREGDLFRVPRIIE